MIVCPTRSASFAVTTRAVASDAPPAGNGTMTVMVRSGYSAACAGGVDTPTEVNVTTTARTLNSCMPPSWPDCVLRVANPNIAAANCRPLGREPTPEKGPEHHDCGARIRALDNQM